MATACAAGDDCGYTYRIEDVVVVLEGVANDDGRGAVDLTGVTSIVAGTLIVEKRAKAKHFLLVILFVTQEAALVLGGSLDQSPLPQGRWDHLDIANPS